MTFMGKEKEVILILDPHRTELKNNHHSLMNILEY